MTCLIIAEIGQNHNGDMKIAKDLIHAAAENGADIAKFQLYDAKSLFPSKEDGNEWFDYNCSTELSRDDLNLLKETCDKAGIEFMSSAFDLERVSWLEDLGVKRHKIASRSIKESDLVNAVAASGKQIIASLGLWDGDNMPKINASGEVSFLYCVCKYPTPLVDLHFEDINFENGTYAGFSDHTIGITAPVTAIARGAKILEKHFTLDQTMHGPDHQGSMTPEELKQISTFRDQIAVCLGETQNIVQSDIMTGSDKVYALK